MPSANTGTTETPSHSRTARSANVTSADPKRATTRPANAPANQTSKATTVPRVARTSGASINVRAATSATVIQPDHYRLNAILKQVNVSASLA